MSEPNKAADLFKENPNKFPTKRSASKYLNHYGKIWKEEHNIPMKDKRR